MNTHPDDLPSWTQPPDRDHIEEYRQKLAREEAQKAEKKAEALAEIERRKQAFQAHVASFEGGGEAIFASQAQLLHGIFAHAVDEYASCGTEEHKAKIYSAIALRAQNYCRMTLAAMARMKEYASVTTPAGKNKETDEQTIIRSGNEALDSGRAPEAIGTDP